MPKLLKRDSDGDAIYAAPDVDDGPAWDLDGDPNKMGTKALCAAVARDILGCDPGWWGYYCDWCCSCDHGDHACDSQCSAIASARQLHDRVIEACDTRGIALLAQRPDKLLQAALIAWRGAKD